MNKQSPQKTVPETALRIIPYYTRLHSLETLLDDAPSRRLLWLEILLNGDFPWEEHCDRPVVKIAYDKACCWYHHYKTMIDGLVARPPLPKRMGGIDEREIRTFQEAVVFVTD